MPWEERTPSGYSYDYHERASSLDDAQVEASRIEDLRYIEETILTLTGACEICQYSTGPFCNKHKHEIKPGDPRCPDFARRLPEDPKKASKAQVQQYVNNTLGVRDAKYARRLTGSE